MTAKTGGGQRQPPPSLPVDRDQLAAFVGAMFRHADQDTYATLRTFLELEEGRPPAIRAVKLNGDPAQLIDATIRQAQQAAALAKPCVFAPPISTFSNAKKAREIDLANGLALSIEIDQGAAAARRRLEFLIGPATAVVASGGTWTDPATGEIQDKLHLHWRLKEPTRTAEAHARLKQARTIATQLVGGDCTNKPIVHPIRWPGSWHRKGEPKLCRIVELRTDAEIDLHAALDALLDVQLEFRAAGGARASDPGEDRDTAELIRRVMTGEELHSCLRDLAWRYLKGGMGAPQVVITLRGLMDAMPEADRDARWQHRRDQIPMLVRTADEKQQESADPAQEHAEISEYDAVVARLAQLKPAEYDKVRKDEAKRLGVRTATLDADVEKARPKLDPADAEPGKGKALELPEPKPWAEPVGGAELIAGLVEQIQRYVIVSDHAALGVALWVLHAHAHDAAFHSPRLTLTSPTMRCGKSTMLRTIGRLIPRPLPTANITPAAMFRVIEAAKPALLIDEADSFAQDNEELRGVINSSHCQLDAYVIRAVPVGDDYEARRFSTWAPMAIASIGKVATTIADRSIMVRLERKRLGETVARMRVDRDDGFGELASKAARYIADHFDDLRGADPRTPPSLNDRAADNWRPLLAIVDLVGGDWPAKARAAALTLSATDEDADTIGVQLLGDIKIVFESTKAESIWTEDLLHHLHAMSEQPWGEYGRQRKPITPRQLATLLKPFAINVRQVWKPEAKANRQGYTVEQFKSAWTRYLSPSPLGAKDSATSSDFSSPSDEEPLGDENPPKATATASSRALGDSDPPSGRKGGNGLGPCAYCRQPIAPDGGHTATSSGAYLHNGCVGPWSRA